MSNRALIVSGGGAKGAWGVGIVKALKEQGVHYNTLIGTSTGSLMGPLILGDQMQELEEAYTNVTSDDIFNVNPFNKKGDIKTLPAAFRLIGGKQSLGESKPLKDLIEKFVDVSLYNKLINGDQLYGVTVTSLSTGRSSVKTINGSQYKDRNGQSFTAAKKESYRDLVNWIWASANQPVFMSLFTDENGEAFVDGGLRDFVTIKYVLEHKLADEIDVLIHNTPDLIDANYKPGGIFSILLRTVDILLTDVAANDIENAVLNVKLDKEVKINFYYMNKAQLEMIPNSLVFEKDKMRQLLDSAYDSIKNNSCRIDNCMITTDGHVVAG